MSDAQTLLTALTDALATVKFLERARTQYHLVVVPDDNRVRVEHFDTQDALVEALRVYVKQPHPPQVIPFIGAPMPITRPPNRQLRTPDGLSPLEVPDEFLDEDDLTWTLGEEAPPQVDVVPQGAADGSVDLDEMEALDDAEDDFDALDDDENDA